MTSVPIPKHLVELCKNHENSSAWLEDLPRVIDELGQRWKLTLEAPKEIDVSVSWISFCTRSDGSRAVFKIAFPHFEGQHEIRGLEIWSGKPFVQLYEHDELKNAYVMEACLPGTRLRESSLDEQDEVITEKLKSLWIEAPAQSDIHPLSQMIRYWIEESLAQEENWPDPILVRKGIDTFESLLDSNSERFLLATDLHAGNVLKAERETWLAIDPKPFVGERAYDLTQHLLNRRDLLLEDPSPHIESLSRRIDIDQQRVKAWLFARCACETGLGLAQTQKIARRLESTN